MTIIKTTYEPMPSHLIKQSSEPTHNSRPVTTATATPATTHDVPSSSSGGRARDDVALEGTGVGFMDAGVGPGVGVSAKFASKGGKATNWRSKSGVSVALFESKSEIESIESAKMTIDRRRREEKS